MKETVVSSLKPLNKEELTRTTKYIIPLIFNDPCVVEEKGFVNAYMADINRPWLQDKLFLVYEYAIEQGKLITMFEKRDDYYDKYYITIDEVSYTVYVFDVRRQRDNIRAIELGRTSVLDIKDKKDIITFWPNENLLELREKYFCNEMIDTIPIEDIEKDFIDILLSYSPGPSEMNVHS